MTQGKQGERKSPSSSSQEMIVSVVFMAEHVTKKVIFNVNMKVSDAIKTVGDKCHISVRLVYPLSHYGLFLPPSENTGGVWLHNEDPINYYHIETKGVLEFKIKPIPLRILILIPDHKNKECTMVIDTTLPVSNIVGMIRLKMRLPEPGAHNCYRLTVENSDEIMHESITLQEQGVTDTSVLILIPCPKKKRRLTKRTLDKRDRLSRFDAKTRGGGRGGGGGGGGGVYGSFIGDVLARTTDNMIPLVAAITRALEYRGIDHEDIFNVTVNESDLKAAKIATNTGDPFVAVDAIKETEMIAALLKEYFNELPEPLVQAQVRGVLARLVAEIQPVQLHYISAICSGLNEGHLYVLQHMLQFFRKILDNTAKNKITQTTLLNTWGPILLRAEHEIEQAECIISLALLLTYHSYICSLKPTPPQFIGLAQAMYPYHTDNDQEISIHAGEYIFVSKQDESGWWNGDLLSGSSGLFPSNYVELLLLFQSDEGDGEGELEHTSNIPLFISLSPPPPPPPSHCSFVCLFDTTLRTQEIAKLHSPAEVDTEDEIFEDISSSNRSSFNALALYSPSLSPSPSLSRSTNSPSLPHSTSHPNLSRAASPTPFAPPAFQHSFSSSALPVPTPKFPKQPSTIITPPAKKNAFVPPPPSNVLPPPPSPRINGYPQSLPPPLLSPSYLFHTCLPLRPSLSFFPSSPQFFVYFSLTLLRHSDNSLRSELDRINHQLEKETSIRETTERRMGELGKEVNELKMANSKLQESLTKALSELEQTRMATRPPAYLPPPPATIVPTPTKPPPPSHLPTSPSSASTTPTRLPLTVQLPISSPSTSTSPSPSSSATPSPITTPSRTPTRRPSADTTHIPAPPKTKQPSPQPSPTKHAKSGNLTRSGSGEEKVNELAEDPDLARSRRPALFSRLVNPDDKAAPAALVTQASETQERKPAPPRPPLASKAKAEPKAELPQPTFDAKPSRPSAFSPRSAKTDPFPKEESQPAQSTPENTPVPETKPPQEAIKETKPLPEVQPQKKPPRPPPPSKTKTKAKVEQKLEAQVEPEVEPEAESQTEPEVEPNVEPPLEPALVRPTPTRIPVPKSEVSMPKIEPQPSKMETVAKRATPPAKEVGAPAADVKKPMRPPPPVSKVKTSATSSTAASSSPAQALDPEPAPPRVKSPPPARPPPTTPKEESEPASTQVQDLDSQPTRAAPPRFKSPLPSRPPPSAPKEESEDQTPPPRFKSPLPSRPPPITPKDEDESAPPQPLSYAAKPPPPPRSFRPDQPANPSSSSSQPAPPSPTSPTSPTSPLSIPPLRPPPAKPAARNPKPSAISTPKTPPSSAIPSQPATSPVSPPSALLPKRPPPPKATSSPSSESSTPPTRPPMKKTPTQK